MFRILVSLLLVVLFANSLSAQNNTAPAGRLATQELSPEDARLYAETTEVADFTRKLGALKTAFTEKDASRMVACEAYILRALQHETEQMKALVNGSEPRLEKMISILNAFEAHAFDPARPEAAARDFAKLDEFLKIMQEELEALKK